MKNAFLIMRVGVFYKEKNGGWEMVGLFLLRFGRFGRLVKVPWDKGRKGELSTFLQLVKSDRTRAADSVFMEVGC